MTDSPKEEPALVFYPLEASVFAAVSSLVFIVVGVTGNSITVLALARCPKLRNATTAFVISLCVSDLLFCTINLPLTASRFIHRQWVLGDALCRLFPFFFYGNVAASLMSMTAITVNRYILINHYRWYDRVYHRGYITIMIILYWAFSFGIMIPPLVGSWGQLGYHRETFSCTILKRDGKSPKKFLFVLGFLLPCVVIIASYSRIFYKVYRSRRALVAHSPSDRGDGVQTASSGLRSDELRLTRLMLVIFCSFLVCFLPLMVVNVFDSVSDPTIHVVASVFAWMSSCINPVIYAIINRQYRQAYLKLLCPSRRHRNRLPVPTKSNGSSSKSGSGSCCTGSGGSKTMVSDIFSFVNGTKKLEQNAVLSLDEVAL